MMIIILRMSVIIMIQDIIMILYSIMIQDITITVTSIITTIMTITITMMSTIMTGMTAITKAVIRNAVQPQHHGLPAPTHLLRQTADRVAPQMAEVPADGKNKAVSHCSMNMIHNGYHDRIQVSVFCIYQFCL